jgi:hypothetical protein
MNTNAATIRVAARLPQGDDRARAFTLEYESNAGQLKPPEVADLPLINLSCDRLL